jgi:hypothetical protein
LLLELRLNGESYGLRSRRLGADAAPDLANPAVECDSERVEAARVADPEAVRLRAGGAGRRGGLGGARGRGC